MLTATRRIVYMDNEYWGLFQALMLLLKPLAQQVFLGEQATHYDDDGNFVKQQSSIVIITNNDLLVLSTINTFITANNIVGISTYAHNVMAGL